MAKQTRKFPGMVRKHRNAVLILISLSNSLVLQAYQSWVRANGRENPLPDLSMSVDQLFFIGFATVCFNTPTFFPPSPLPVVVA